MEKEKSMKEGLNEVSGKSVANKLEDTHMNRLKDKRFLNNHFLN
jgi:hypothetical protein